jgi:DNA-binding MurR/RpiR family transcriptional regulator
MINEIKIKSIQEKIKKALALIEKEENVKIGFGSISFNVAQYIQFRFISFETHHPLSDTLRQ